MLILRKVSGFLRRLRAGKRNRDRQAPLWTRSRVDDGRVGLSHRADDRKPETEALAVSEPIAAIANEWLEQPRYSFRSNGLGAVVVDV